MSSTSDQRFREYDDYDPVPLAREDATWKLDDLYVHADLEKPVRRRIEVVDYEDADAAPFDTMAPSPALISSIWTAAQVAATSLALGSYLTGAVRKWRDKRVELPEGTRLTLTLMPAKLDDRRRLTTIVISDIHAKTPDEITNEIRRTLMTYADVPHQEVDGAHPPLESDL
jgi:hypothetical protein